jgi:hypothetical protein
MQGFNPIPWANTSPQARLPGQSRKPPARRAQLQRPAFAGFASHPQTDPAGGRMLVQGSPAFAG